MPRISLYLRNVLLATSAAALTACGGSLEEIDPENMSDTEQAATANKGACKTGQEPNAFTTGLSGSNSDFFRRHQWFINTYCPMIGKDRKDTLHEFWLDYHKIYRLSARVDENLGGWTTANTKAQCEASRLYYFLHRKKTNGSWETVKIMSKAGKWTSGGCENTELHLNLRPQPRSGVTSAYRISAKARRHDGTYESIVTQGHRRSDGFCYHSPSVPSPCFTDTGPVRFRFNFGR